VEAQGGGEGWGDHDPVTGLKVYLQGKSRSDDREKKKTQRETALFSVRKVQVEGQSLEGGLWKKKTPALHITRRSYNLLEGRGIGQAEAAGSHLKKNKKSRRRKEREQEEDRTIQAKRHGLYGVSIRKRNADYVNLCQPGRGAKVTAKWPTKG